MSLLDLLTQVDPLCLRKWLICHEFSHIGGPLGMPPLGHGLLVLHLVLYNRSH